MNDIATRLEALNFDRRRQVYSRLWLELTVCGRDIWSNDRFTHSEKLDGLKWLNEIQHRVWHGYMDSRGYSPADLLERIDGHIQQAEHIRGHIRTYFDRALNSLAGT